MVGALRCHSEGLCRELGGVLCESRPCGGGCPFPSWERGGREGLGGLAQASSDLLYLSIACLTFFGPE